MKKSWNKIRLDEFVKFQRGFDLPKDNFVEGTVPVYGSTSILGFHNIAKVKAPGVITGRSGTLGKFQFANEDFWPHNTSLWVKDFKWNDPKFAYYLMQCLDFADFNSGGAVPTLNRNVLRSFKVDVPPLPTQQKIAKILSAYDDLIENNLQRIKLLEEMAQITYEEWFVRMKFPDHETAKFDEETGLPEGWKIVKIKELVYFSQGLQVPIENQSLVKKESYHRFIRIVDITQGGQEDRYVFAKNKRYMVEEDDLFMIRYGSPMPVIGYKGIIANNFFKIEVKDKGVLDTKYLYYFLSQKYISDYLLSISVSSTMPAISFSTFGHTKIILPSISIQKKFEKKNNTLLGIIRVFKNQNQSLKEARDILLPRLMTGMIDVEKISGQVDNETERELTMAAEDGVEYKNEKN